MSDKVKNNGDNYTKISKKKIISIDIIAIDNRTFLDVWTNKEDDTKPELIQINNIIEDDEFYIIKNK